MPVALLITERENILGTDQLWGLQRPVADGMKFGHRLHQLFGQRHLTTPKLWIVDCCPLTVCCTVENTHPEDLQAVTMQCNKCSQTAFINRHIHMRSYNPIALRLVLSPLLLQRPINTVPEFRLHNVSHTYSPDPGSCQAQRISSIAVAAVIANLDCAHTGNLSFFVESNSF